MTYLQKYVPSKTKDVNVKVFNMITNRNEAKTIIKHLMWLQMQVQLQLAIQIKNAVRKHVNVSVKIILHAKKIIVEILAHVFVIMVTLLTIQKVYVLKLYVMDNVSTNFDAKK